MRGRFVISDDSARETRITLGHLYLLIYIQPESRQWLPSMTVLGGLFDKII
jgi:hypothetical protein